MANDPLAASVDVNGAMPAAALVLVLASLFSSAKQYATNGYKQTSDPLAAETLPRTLRSTLLLFLYEERQIERSDKGDSCAQAWCWKYRMPLRDRG